MGAGIVEGEQAVARVAYEDVASADIARFHLPLRQFRQGLTQLYLRTTGGNFPVQTLAPMKDVDAVALHAGLLDRRVRTVLHRDDNATGARMTAYDPFTTVPVPGQAGAFTRTPLAGNIVPASRMNPIALNMQKYYPLPNRPGQNFTHLNK